jgi:transcriptional regulator
MRQNPGFTMTDRGEIERIIRENPWATFVSDTSTGLVASH